MENTLNNISEKSKIIFVDGIPDKKDSNGNNIARDLSDTYKNAVFFTDDSNVPENEKETGNKKEYYNIWKGGKRYTKFQDVKDGNYISIGTHKIYLKNDNGFLYLTQGKDIIDLEILKVLQKKYGNTSDVQTTINTSLNSNNIKTYEPPIVTIDSVDNKFKINYNVILKSNLSDDDNNEIDDNSGDKSLKFSFWTKDSSSLTYNEAPSYLEYLPSDSSIESQTYGFKCLKPANDIYIKATSEYDAEMYCYYPVNININVTKVIYRNAETGRLLENEIYMKINDILKIEYEYYPEEANNILLETSQNNEYYLITYPNLGIDHTFELTAIQVTKNLINGYTNLQLKLGNQINYFKVYITKDAKYYWYIGFADPRTYMTIDNAIENNINTNKFAPGFHLINEKFTYTKDSPLINAEYNPIILGENKQQYYLLLPNNMPNNNNLIARHEIYDSNLGDNRNIYVKIEDNIIYDEVSYTLYQSIIPNSQFNGKIFSSNEE